MDESKLDRRACFALHETGHVVFYNLNGTRRTKSRLWSCASAISIMFCVALVRSHGAGAATYDAGPADYAMIVKSLKPGDTLRLLAGEYRQGLALHLLTGTPEKPITIEGEGEVVFRAREGHNTVSIVDSSYVIVRNLD